MMSDNGEESSENSFECISVSSSDSSSPYSPCEVILESSDTSSSNQTTNKLEACFEIERVIRDGNVAVIYQPYHCRGWYSSHEVEALLFDPKLVQMIENRISAKKIAKYCQQLYSGELQYFDIEDFEGLEIRWVPVSSEFRIQEYDGSETITLRCEDKWFVA